MHKPAKPPRRGPRPADGEGWIWGLHAAKAALANPARVTKRVMITRNAAQRMEIDLAALRAEPSEPRAMDAALPQGAVHQGAAVLATSPAPLPLESLLAEASGRVVVLDQITDPQNVGAIFRSAAAFGARAVVMQDRKAPPLFGALAKAAVGAAEIVPHVSVVNIARTLDALREAGWRCVALAGEAETTIAEACEGEPVGLVLGAEGKGLRPAVQQACDLAASIPIAEGMESLNVSAAAAIALYEAARTRQRL